MALFKLKNKKDDKDQANLLQKDISLGWISFTEKTLFVKQLSVMLRAGVSITAALYMLSESASSAFKKTLIKIAQAVESGRSLAESMSRHPKAFTPMIISSVYAGEISGNLVENLIHVAEELEKQKRLREKVKGSLTYPVIVLIATVLIAFAMAFFVLPKIVPLFQGLKVDLPFTTRALINFSEFIEANTSQVLITTIVAMAAFVFLLKQSFMKPFRSWFLLSFPISKKITKFINIDIFCRTLGSLLESGLTINEALDVTEKTVTNYHYNKAIKKSLKHVLNGSRLSENLERYPKLFPLTVTRMIRVGEESGELGNNLKYLADFYESEVDTMTKSLASSIEPLLLTFIGLIVGFLALSIVTPIYEITGNIQK